MNLLDKDIQDNTDLMQVLQTKGILADGQVGKELIQALLKAFPKEKTKDGVGLESQQLDYMAQVGAWQALTHQNKINNVQPGGLFYMVEQKQAGVKDLVRFNSALCEMDKIQIDQSFLCVKDFITGGENPNPFANALRETAQEYGVRVGNSPEQYLE